MNETFHTPPSPEGRILQTPVPEAPLAEAEVPQFAMEPSGFFRRRLENLKSLWQHTKEVGSRTAETIIPKPVRLVGAIALDGAYATMDASRAINTAVQNGVHGYVEGLRQAEIDKQEGYDENTLAGRLGAKLHGRAFNPRPKLSVQAISGQPIHQQLRNDKSLREQFRS